MTKTFDALRRGWFWAPFSPWRIRRQGRADGRLQPPVPPWTAVEQPPYVMEIKRAGDGDLQLITLGWDREDQELKAHYSEAHKHQKHCHEKYEKAEQNFSAAVIRYQGIHTKPAPTSPHRGTLLYFGIATLISIFEIPLNLSFFRLFGESEVLTIVATVGLAFSLMFCAHFLGLMLKQGEFGSHIRKVLIGCMVAIPLTLIGGVASLRVAYLHQIDETTRTISSAVLLVVSAALNLLMVTVATVAAYAFHEEGRAEVDATRRDLCRATNAKDRAEKTLATLEERRRKIFDSHKTRAQHIKDVAEGLIEAYRTANLAARTDRDQQQASPYPASYLQEVVVKIPMPLRSPEPQTLGPAKSAFLSSASRSCFAKCCSVSRGRRMKRIIVFLACWTTLSKLAAAPPESVICVLFDLSRSAQNVRLATCRASKNFRTSLLAGSLSWVPGLQRIRWPLANSRLTLRFRNTILSLTAN